MTKKSKRGSYPKWSLKDTLQISQAIQDNNAGKPYARLDLAKALGRTPSSSAFRGLITASNRFGLTIGSYNAINISLTERGSIIVSTLDENMKNNALKEALLSIKEIKIFFDKFNGQKLPNLENVVNTLAKDFDMNEEYVKPCFEMIMKNLRELDLLDNIGGNDYVRLEKMSVYDSEETPVTEVIDDSSPDKSADIVESEYITEEEEIITPLKQNKIFVIHGKDKKPLEQLKVILDGFKVPYSVAIDEPYGGRPISLKIAELMRECTSAIVIFTADEKYQDSDGNEYYRPSDNTVYELGAAGVLYSNKIMILKEDNVSLASDFSDLGYISFEKGKLTAKAMELFKELINFDLVEIKAK